MSEAEKDWSKVDVNIAWKMLTHEPPVFVIRIGDHYARIPNTGGWIATPSARMATRFDSHLWAQTVANAISAVDRDGKPAKVAVRRLFTKAEKELRRAGSHLGGVATWMRADVATTSPVAPADPVAPETAEK